MSTYYFSELEINNVFEKVGLLGSLVVGALGSAIKSLDDDSIRGIISGMAVAAECGEETLSAVIALTNCQGKIDELNAYVHEHIEEVNLVAPAIKQGLEWNPVVRAVRTYGKELTISKLFVAAENMLRDCEQMGIDTTTLI